MRVRFFHGLLSSLLCSTGLSAQHMTSVSVTPGVFIPVHTARNHLTVLDLDSPIKDLAAENKAFDIEWRGHTVFVLPKEPDQSTNLFVWTEQGRVVYELLPPVAAIEAMDVSVDTHFPPHAPVSKPVSASTATDAIPADLLVRAQSVAVDSKKARHEPNLRISDVYRRQDSLFLRYEVRNNGSGNLRVDATPVVTAASMSHVSSSRPIQLTPDKASSITTGAPLPLIADQTGASSLAPGQIGRGVIGVHLPPGSSSLAVRLSVPSASAPLQAMVVVP